MNRKALTLIVAFSLLVVLFIVSAGTVAAAPPIVFDGSPGTNAPPANLGPYAMTPFPDDTRPLGNDVGRVPGPTGDVNFSKRLRHVEVGSGWATWSHGYTGDVYGTHLTGSPNGPVVISLPPNTGAFYFYAEPEQFAGFRMQAWAQDGTASGPIVVQGNSGAQYFGFYSTFGVPLSTIRIDVAGDANGFAIGEFGIAQMWDTADLIVEKRFVGDPAEGVPGGDPLHFQVRVRNAGPGPAHMVSLHDLLFGLDYIVYEIAIPEDDTGLKLWSCETGLTCTRHDPMPVMDRDEWEVFDIYLKIPSDAHLTVGHTIGTGPIVFDGSPGTAAPPATLGPYTMMPFGPDPQGSPVTSVAGPTGPLGFDQSLAHTTVPAGWSTWSHGYTGDVYHNAYSAGPYSIVMTLPPNTGAFYFYAEPNQFQLFDVTATAQDGTTSGPIPVQGNSGATYFGFYSSFGVPLATIQVDLDLNATSGFAVGEFGIAELLPAGKNCVNVTALNPDLEPENNNFVCVPVPLAPTADLRLEKTALIPEVSEGGSALFKVTVYNDGPSDVVGLTIDDPLPAGFVGPAVIAPADAAPGGAGIAIPAGGHAEVFVSLKVDADAVAVGDTLTNEATVEVPPDYVDPTPGVETAQASVTIIDALTEADVEVLDVRLVGGGPIVPGEMAIFEIDVINNGPSEAYGAVATSTFWRAGFTLEDAYSSPPDIWQFPSSGGVYFRNAPMPVGTTETLELHIRVSPDAHYESLIGGIYEYASIAAANPDSDTANNLYWGATLDVQAVADFRLRKVLLNDGVAAGGTALYDVDICNAGPSDIRGVFLDDTPGVGLDAGSLVISEAAGGGKLRIPAFQCRDLMVSARVLDSAVEGDPICNEATLDLSQVVAGPGSTLAPDVSLNSGESTLEACGQVGAFLPEADIAINSWTCNAVKPGANSDTTCTIEIQNRGDALAWGVLVSNRLSNIAPQLQNAAFVSTTEDPMPADQFRMYNCSESRCTRNEPMPAGAIDTLKFTFRGLPDAHLVAHQSRGINSWAFVSMLNPDANLINNGPRNATVAGTTPSSMAVEPAATIRIEKVLLTPSVAQGGTALFQVTLYNDGPSDVDGLRINDQIIAGPGTILSVSPAEANANAAGSGLYIGAGGHATIMVAVAVDASAATGDTITNEAVLDVGVVDDGVSTLATLTGYNNNINFPATVSAQASVTVSPYLPESDMDATTTIVPLNAPVAGQVYRYQVWVENNGPAPAEGVAVKQWFDGVPNGYTLVNDPTAAAGAHILGWECSQGLDCSRTGAMPVGKEHIGTFAIRLPADAVTHGVFPQRHGMFVTHDNPDPNILNNWVIRPLRIRQLADLRITKRVLTQGSAPGSTALFEIVVRNIGPSDAAGVRVIDQITSGPGTVIGMSPDANNLYIPAGQTRDLLVSVRVAQAAVPGDIIINCARVRDIPSGAINQACARLVVGEPLPVADVELTDVDIKYRIVPGKVAEFRVWATNNGPAEANGAVMTLMLGDLPYFIQGLVAPDGWENGSSGLTWLRTEPWPAQQEDAFRALVHVPSDAAYQASNAADKMGGVYAAVAAANPDSVPSNNGDWASQIPKDVRSRVEATLAVEKTLLNDGVAAGGTALYEITVCNDGPSDVRGVKVVDTPGVGLDAATLVLSADAENLYVPADDCVDVMASVKVLDSAVPGDPFSNSALLEVDLDYAQGTTAMTPSITLPNAATEDGTVGEPLPLTSLSMGLDCTDVAVPGELFACTLTIENTGPAIAYDVVLQNNLFDIEYVFDYWSPPSVYVCGTGETCVRSLPMDPGEVDTLTLGYTLSSDAHLDGVAGMYAYFYAEAYAVAINAPATYDQDFPEFVAEAELDIEKIALTENPAPGGTVLFEIVVTNNGPSDVKGLEVEDVVSGPGALFALSPDADDLYVAAGQSASIIASVTVDDGAVPGDIILNTATLNASHLDAGLADRYDITYVDSSAEARVRVDDYLPETDMGVTKWPFLSSVTPGESIEFTLYVTNHGPAVAQNVMLVDRLLNVDAIIEDIVVSGGFEWNCSAGLTCVRRDPMPAGHTDELFVTLRIPADAHLKNLTFLGPGTSNFVAVVADNPDPGPNPNFWLTLVGLTPTADLEIEKTLLTDGVAPGGVALFELVVWNHGPSDVHIADVNDMVMAGPGVAEVISADADMLYVPAGQSRDILVAVAVDDAAAVGDTIENCAEVTLPGRWRNGFRPEWPWFYNDPDWSNNGLFEPADISDPVCSTLTVGEYLPPADIDATATIVPLNAPVAGQVYEYEVWVENLGPAPAEGVQVKQWFQGVPNGWTLVNDPAAAAGAHLLGWECGQGLDCSRTGSMPVGKEHVGTFEILLPADAVTHGIFPQAHGLFATVDNPDPNIYNNWEITRLEIAVLADLDIKKVLLTDGVAPGGVALFEIVVTNNGPSDAEGVRVNDYIDSGPGSVEKMSPDRKRLYIPAGETRDVLVSVRVWDSAAVGDKIKNCAEVKDIPSGDINKSCATLTVGEYLPPADMDATTTVVPLNAAVAGEPYTFEVYVENNGPAPAEGATAHHTFGLIPSDWQVLDITPGLEWQCDGGGMSCTRIGSMEVGRELVATFTVLLPPDALANGATPGTAVHDLAVTADNPDPVLRNNRHIAHFDIFGTAVLDVIKSDLKDPIGQGEDLIYEITVQNEGPSTLPPFSVVVTDSLPPELEYVGASPECYLDGFDPVTGGELVVCIVPDDLDPDETYDLMVQAWVPEDLTPGLIVTNTVYAAAPDLFEEQWRVAPDMYEETTEIWVGEEADLKIIKHIKPDGEVQAGNPFTYTVYVDNLGPTAAELLEIVDSMTGSGSYTIIKVDAGADDATCTQPPIDSAGLNNQVTVVCTKAVLEAYDRWTVIIVGIANETMDVNNVARVFAEYPRDPYMENNYAEGAIAVTDAANLSIKKTDSADPVTAGGDTYKYTLTVDNDGPSTAENVVVVDTLPLEVDIVDITNAAGGSCATVQSAAGNEQVICTIGEIAVDGEKTIKIEVMVKPGVADGTRLYNQAVVFSENIFDPDNSDNVAREGTDVEASATIFVAKYGEPDPVVAGEMVEFPIQIRNDGPSAAINVRLHDQNGANMEYLQFIDADVMGSPGAQCFAVDSAMHCDLNDLPVGQMQAVVARFLVDPATPAGTVITNVVSLTADSPDPVLIATGSITTETTTVEAEAELEIVKSSFPLKIPAGEQKTYTIEVVNRGPSVALDVEVVDTLPADVTYEIDTALCDVTGQEVTCDLGSLGPDEHRVFEIVGLVGTDAIGMITNTATVASSTYDPNAETNEAFSRNLVWAGADLRVEKADYPDPVVPGETLEYTIFVDNDGPSDAVNVTVTDTLPPEVTYDDGASSVECDAVGDLVVCDLGTMAPGDHYEVTIVADVDATLPPETDTLYNRVEVASDTGDPDPLNNVDTEETRIQAMADIGVDKDESSSSPFWAGEEIEYSIVVNNNGGPSTAENVVAVDTLPAGLTFVKVKDWSGSEDCTIEESFGDTVVTCMIGNLDHGDDFSFTVVALVDPNVMDDTQLYNSVCVSSDVPDPDNKNNCEVEWTTISAESEFAVNKDGNPDPVYAGEEVNYRIELTNEGPSTAWNVTLEDDFNAGAQYLTFLEANFEAGSGECYAEYFQPQGDIEVRCNLGDIEPGRVIRIDMRFLVDAGFQPIPGNIFNEIFLDADSDIGWHGDDDENIEVQGRADVGIEKSSQPHAVFAGEEKEYTITVTNYGPSAAGGVQVVDTLPAGVTYKIDNGGCTAAGQVVTCDLGTMASGQVLQFQIWAEVNADTLPGAVLVNTATVSTTTTDENAANDTATADNLVEGKADLDITKFGKPDGEVYAGDYLTYTVIVDNLGTGYAHGVVLTDVIQSDGVFELVGYESDRAVVDCGPADGVFTETLKFGCALAEPLEVLGPDSGRWTLRMVVVAQETQDINNIARVMTSDYDPNLENNEAVAMHEIVDNADLEVVKSAAGEVAGRDDVGGPLTPDQVTAGLVLEYTIEVTNHGPSTADNVMIEDTVDQWARDMGVDIIEAPAECETGWPLVCPLGELAVGETVTIVFEVAVPSSVPCGLIENDVRVWSDIYDRNNINNHANTLTEVDNWVDLDVDKDQQPDIVFPGGDIEYSIEVYNDGPSDGKFVSIRDEFPPEVLGVQWECNAHNGASCPSMADGTDYWYGDIDHQVDLPAGSWVTIVATGVRDPMSPVKYFENWVEAYPNGCQQELNPGDNEDYDYNEPYTVFAPIVARTRIYEPGPDLIVLDVYATQCDFYVTLHNRGKDAVTDHFWVDIYIDPTYVPKEANQMWPHVGLEGVALKVLGDALPIGQEETVTINLWDAGWEPTPYYHDKVSYVYWPVELGSPIWVQADSRGDESWGRIEEVHEAHGFWYNNISGPYSAEVGECEGFPPLLP